MQTLLCVLVNMLDMLDVLVQPALQPAVPPVAEPSSGAGAFAAKSQKKQRRRAARAASTIAAATPSGLRSPKREVGSCRSAPCANQLSARAREERGVPLANRVCVIDPDRPRGCVIDPDRPRGLLTGLPCLLVGGSRPLSAFIN